MPKTNTKRNLAYVSKSLVGEPTVQTFNKSGGNTKGKTTRNPRNVIGDSGMAALKAKGRGTASPSTNYATPTQKKKSAAKAKKTVAKAAAKTIKKVKGKK